MAGILDSVTDKRILPSLLLAIQVFKTGMVLTDDTLRSAVVKEMELMQSVRHESIVTFLGPIYVRQSDGSTDLVGYAMERMECDLKAYLLRKRQQGQLGIKTVLEVLEQVSDSSGVGGVVLLLLLLIYDVLHRWRGGSMHCTRTLSASSTGTSRQRTSWSRTGGSR